MAITKLHDCNVAEKWKNIANESKRMSMPEKTDSKPNDAKTTESDQAPFPLFESDYKVEVVEKVEDNAMLKSESTHFHTEILWTNVAMISLVHLFALYGLWALGQIQRCTFIYFFTTLLLTSVGVQAGTHRLWSHRSYKANFGLRLVLSILHLVGAQNDIYQWARDHRVHHKYAETEADPHNIKRGFFFAHVGWLMVKKRPEVAERGKMIDLSDLHADPIVMFQRRHYLPLMLLFWGVIPAAIPILLWNEPVVNAVATCVFLRYAYTLNTTWCANSWCHAIGYRPYDKRMAAVDSTIRHMIMGEGFHNYHHAFAWDYSASELGASEVFNPMTALINFWAWMGWAWDLRKPSRELIDKTMLARGDGVVNYRMHSPLYEYVTGFFVVFAPLFLIRLILVSNVTF